MGKVRDSIILTQNKYMPHLLDDNSLGVRISDKKFTSGGKKERWKHSQQSVFVICGLLEAKLNIFKERHMM